MVWTLTVDFSVAGLRDEMEKVVPSGSLIDYFTLVQQPHDNNVWSMTTKSVPNEQASEMFVVYKAVDDVAQKMEATDYHNQITKYMSNRP